jgi:hypothetical protein
MSDAVAGVAGVQDVLGEEHLGASPTRVMKSSDTTRRRSTGAEHARRRQGKVMPVAGALASVARAGLTPRPQRLRGEGDGQEARGVDEQRDRA